MCVQVTCPVCKKPTWSGCGQHKEQVLAGIPVDQRCQCTDAQKAGRSNGGSFFSRLFGR